MCACIGSLDLGRWVIHMGSIYAADMIEKTNLHYSVMNNAFICWMPRIPRILPIRSSILW